MSVPVIAFFNNKGGVGKTSLVYHLSWMYSEIGLKVLSSDFDPQANLTSAFLDDDRLAELWPEDTHDKTVYGSIEPLLRGIGDISERPYVEEITDNLHLLVGDLSLARFEEELSSQWPLCLDGKERAYRVISAFWRILQRGANEIQADVVLVDLGPNLGAINRAALVASDYLIVPLAPDLFSLQGLKNLGPTIRTWRKEWEDRRIRCQIRELGLPEGKIEPKGYIFMQHAMRLDRPVKAYERWAARIPNVYSSEVLEQELRLDNQKKDPHCLGLVKHYRSLMPMAQEAHKPMFYLTPADGAIGSHAKAVMDAKENFRQLAMEIAKRCDINTREHIRCMTSPSV